MSSSEHSPNNELHDGKLIDYKSGIFYISSILSLGTLLVIYTPGN